MGRTAQFHRIVVLAGAALLLAGCGGGGLFGKSAPPTYELAAAEKFPARPAARRGQLVVPEPTMLAPLDSERVMVRYADGQTAQLANAQWEDRLPKLVQTRIIQSFENGSRLRAVGRPSDRLAADYQLVMDVRSFQVMDATGSVEVEIAAKIVGDKSGRIVAARIFKATVPAESGTTGTSAINALNEAFGKVAAEMVLWVSRQV